MKYRKISVRVKSPQKIVTKEFCVEHIRLVYKRECYTGGKRNEKMCATFIYENQYYYYVEYRSEEFYPFSRYKIAKDIISKLPYVDCSIVKIMSRIERINYDYVITQWLSKLEKLCKDNT